MKWFSYSQVHGFELHDTKEQAIAQSESAIEYYQDDAADGWPDEVEYVCWGEIKQWAIERNKRKARVGASVDYLVDYKLRKPREPKCAKESKP